MDCSTCPTSGDSGATEGSTAGPLDSTADEGTDDPPAPATIVLEEDEPSFCGALGVIETSRPGFGGAGYLDSEDLPRVGISWVVEVEEPGEYLLTWRYAASGPASARVRVGHRDVETIELLATADAWDEQGVSVALSAGVNHLSLVAASPGGLPDIDALSVSGAEGLSAASCLEYEPGAGLDYVPPVFVDQSVHDPSVIEDDGAYYVFGSHGAAARTTDFVQWDLVADGVNPSNPLFEDITTELSDAYEWSTVVGLWAADVHRLESTGQFLYYYNSCVGNAPLSAMGIAASDDIEGLYHDLGVFMTSGGPGYNAAVLPNAVDPDAFYDADGVLRMVYGSYSGGIFMLDMDPGDGFPLPGQGAGTHLLGGNHIPIEGPFIQYSPETGFYYLMTSYGGFGPEDGYQIRIARATEPHGPYYDHAGLDQSTVDGLPFEHSGVKLLGNHRWAGLGGGYVSPGHNSSYYDAATGKYYVVFHTRFEGAGFYHEIRVHEMFMNIDGWPVAAPLRYAPRINDSGVDPIVADYVGRGEIHGTYQIVDHGRDVSGFIRESVEASLGADGSVSGALRGSWTFGGNNLGVLDLGGTSFRGVFSRQWNELTGQFQVTYTGLNSSGEALWGIRLGD